MSNYQSETVTCVRDDEPQTALWVDSVKNNETKTISKVAGTTLCCTSGEIWVTFEDDPNDYVLSDNKTVFVPNEGKVLVSGIGEYRIAEEQLAVSDRGNI